jgi:myosin heavy subunit
MSTNKTSPTPTPMPGSNQPDKSQQNFKIGAIIAIAVLAIICAVLVFNLVSKNKANDSLTYELNESEQLKAELEKQYYEALSELEELRGSNEELNALIESQKTELKESKDRIDALLRDSRNLKKARQEMKGLTAQVEQYLAEINQLREENELLTARTVELTAENNSLNTNLDSARVRNMELSSAKAALTSEKETLEADRARLAKKVNIASVIKVGDIEVQGLKSRSSGKAVTRKSAKNIDQLQVCFQASANQVAEAGVEEFLIRVINPLGETMAIEELGSGIFTNNASGEQIRYTQIKDTDYDKSEQNLCTIWAPNQPFQSGNYSVEIYNKGYLAGSSTFKLR